MTAAPAIPPASPPSPDQIRDLADTILARPDYQLESQRADWASLSEWIGNIIDWIFGPITRGLESVMAISPVLGWLLVALMAALSVALIVHIVFTVLSAIRGPAVALRFNQADEPAGDPADWECRAREAAARGDVIGGIRCLFRAGVLRIEASRKRAFRRGATNHEILRAVNDSAVADDIAAFVDTIDYKWYGGADCSAEDLERCSAAYDRIRSLTRETPHAARP